jgi:23S rRNA pseudouridine1911/1915/1917 synthase
MQAHYRVDPRHAGLRADVFLALHAPQLSRSRIKRLIQTGAALVNGHRLASSTRLREGDALQVAWRDDDDATPGAAWPLVVLYEDEHLLAVDKPAGMAVHPVGRKQSGSLVQAVRERYAAEIAAALERGDPEVYPGLAHRLDLFTSGVVLLARNRPALVALQRAVAAGAVDKRYLAIVQGAMTGEGGTIDAPIGPAPGSAVRIRRAVRADGLRAATDWRVLERLRDATLVAVTPRTGRQHQIRVHLASVGHPVWGDLIYGDERLFLRYVANGCRLDGTLPPRQALHAEAVRFRHPATGAPVGIVSPMPEDFARILQSLR